MLERIKKKLLTRSSKKSKDNDTAMATKKKAAAKKAAAKKAPVKKVAKKVAAKKAPAKKVVTKKAVVKKTAKKVAAKKAVAKKAVAKKVTKKAVTKKAVAKPVKKVAAKATKKAVTKKAVTKKAVVKKAAVKKTPAKKTPAKKVTAKKVPEKKIVAKKVTAKAAKPSPVKPAAQAEVKAAPKRRAATRTSATKKVVKRKPMNAALSSQLQQFEDFEPYNMGKKEEYMSDPMKDHFRALLHSWRSELMQEVDRTVDHMKDDASNFADPNDRATQEEEFALELRTRDRERKLIRKIGKTLDRVDEDDYGWCDQCGIEVGVRRLEARPTANLCIDCKTLDEIREKQTKL